MVGAKKAITGSVTVEYTIVIVFLMIIIWYGVVGGSVSPLNPTTQTGTGNQLDNIDPSATAYPGVANALHDKQVVFRGKIGQP